MLAGCLAADSWDDFDMSFDNDAPDFLGTMDAVHSGTAPGTVSVPVPTPAEKPPRALPVINRRLLLPWVRIVVSARFSSKLAWFASCGGCDLGSVGSRAANSNGGGIALTLARAIVRSPAAGSRLHRQARQASAARGARGGLLTCDRCMVAPLHA